MVVNNFLELNEESAVPYSHQICHILANNPPASGIASKAKPTTLFAINDAASCSMLTQSYYIGALLDHIYLTALIRVLKPTHR